MKKPSLKYSIFIMLTAFGIVTVPVILFSTSIQPLFLLSIAATIPMCMKLGYSFADIQNGMTEYSKKAVSPIIFMLSVGAMTGVWNSCGTVAEITKLGIQLISPSVFLPASFLLCLIFAFLTGSAFGTCGTLGIALMVMSASFSIPLLTTAGSVITGTYFGYVFSPLSDYNNLAAGLAEKDIPAFISCQLKVTAPSAIICLAVYAVMNLQIDSSVGSIQDSAVFVDEIGQIFKGGLINYLPLVIVLVIMLLRKPTLIAIFSGIVSGALLSIFYQGNSFSDVIGAIWSGASVSADNQLIASIFSRGGMQSMSGVSILFILAFCLMGILNTCNITEVIMAPVESKINGIFSAAIYTFAITFIINAMSASGITSCVIVLGFMLPVYMQKKIDVSILLTVTTIGGILATLVIPWHSNCVNPASFLGINPSDMITIIFAPWVAAIVCAVYLILKKLSLKN